MKKFSRIPKAKLILFLLILPLLLSIQNRGSFSYSNPSGKHLTNSTRMFIGSISSGFVGGVGGVSFDQVAKPVNGLTINSLVINYDASKPDGKRCQLIINNQPVNVDIYDWQLIPISRYANSMYYSCFTLFGELDDKNLQKEIISQNGRVMNYHPEFENTLLGLRIADMDMLILYDFVTELPRMNNSFLLGIEEVMTDIESNKRGFNAFQDYFKTVKEQLNVKHRSWVITDYTRNITFSTSGNQLNISSTPYFYCWRYKMDQDSYDIEKVYQEKAEEIINKITTETNGEYDEVIAKIAEMIIDCADQYIGKHDFYNNESKMSVLFNPLIKSRSNTDQMNYINSLTPEERLSILVNTHTFFDAYTVIHLKEYSSKISEQTNLLRNINPQVWDATVNTMRYAAFFRYVKTNFPTQWKAYVSAIGSRTTTPEVETPTVFYPSDNLELSKKLNSN